LKSAAERISRLVRLTARERRLLVRAWWQLLLVGAALRVVPLTWLLLHGVAVRPRMPPMPAERIAWLLEIARRYSPVRSTCLTDALVLVRLLRGEGIDAVLKVGVAHGEGALRAHAWVEYRGRVLLGGLEDETYAPLLAAVQPPSVR
jgi:hypothetical protein